LGAIESRSVNVEELLKKEIVESFGLDAIFFAKKRMIFVSLLYKDNFTCFVVAISLGFFFPFLLALLTEATVEGDKKG
jgi:hypothetical protein